MINNKSRALLIFVLSVCTSVAQAGGIFEITVDFETDAGGNFLVNGRAITAPPTGNTDIETDDSPNISPPADTGQSIPEGNGEQFVSVNQFFTITTTGDEHVGAVIFDSTPQFLPGLGTSGPNSIPIGNPGDQIIADPDLLVNLGNILILQEDQDISGADVFEDLIVPGVSDPTTRVFRRPDDDTNEGSIFFNFFGAVEPVSIDLIDFNGGAGGEVTLTDVDGNERIFTVPEEFTFDLAEVLDATEGDPLGDGDPSNDAEEGFATLLFDELARQNGEGRLDGGNPILTSVTDNGAFDISQVVTIEVAFEGTNPSGGIDNLVFLIPEPTAGLLLGIASVCLAARRRRAVLA